MKCSELMILVPAVAVLDPKAEPVVPGPVAPGVFPKIFPAPPPAVAFVFALFPKKLITYSGRESQAVRRRS